MKGRVKGNQTKTTVVPTAPDLTREQPSSTSPLWGTKEVAVFLNVKESTIRNWVHTSYIPRIKFRGAVRFQREEISSWVKTLAVDGAPDRSHKIAGEIFKSIRR